MIELSSAMKCRLIEGEVNENFCEMDSDYLGKDISCVGDLQGKILFRTDKGRFCRFPLERFETMPKNMLNDLVDVKRDRWHTYYIDKHCPSIREQKKELIEEYGTERPPASLADELAKGLSIVEKTEKGVKVTQGGHRVQKIAEKLEKKIKDEFHKTLEEEFGPIQRKESEGIKRKRKPYSENYILYQICRMKEDMNRGRTGSNAQQRRHEIIKKWLYVLDHPEERDMPFLFGKHYI